MDNTIFFGNGINLVAGGKSWDDILKDMSFRDSLPEINSNTLKYEYILLQKPQKQFVPLLLKGKPLLLAGKIYGEFFDTENGVVKRKLCDKLKRQPYSPYYAELFNLNTQNYITTNYEQLLNNEFETNGFSHKDSDNSQLLYVRDSLYKNTQSVSIWNIHGNLKTPESIMLGIKDYCDYVSEINQYIKEDHSEAEVTRCQARCYARSQRSLTFRSHSCLISNECLKRASASSYVGFFTSMIILFLTFHAAKLNINSEISSNL